MLILSHLCKSSFASVDDSLLQKKVNKDIIQHITERIDVSRSFLQLFRPQVEYDLVSITDVCGPTAWDPNIQALVVSKETISGADYGKPASPFPARVAQPIPRTTLS